MNVKFMHHLQRAVIKEANRVKAMRADPRCTKDDRIAKDLKKRERMSKSVAKLRASGDYVTEFTKKPRTVGLGSVKSAFGSGVLSIKGKR